MMSTEINSPSALAGQDLGPWLKLAIMRDLEDIQRAIGGQASWL